jgi:unsaturated rhamnogalacturonyl hydrolase
MTVLDYADAYATAYLPYKGGAWCYEDGCVYRGLDLLHKATGETRWLDHIIRLTDPQIGPDGALAGYDPCEYNIDNIQAGRCLFPLAEATGEPRYMAAADRLAAQLATHPRTRGGNYWHKAIYPHQVWLDGLYMGLPFQIEYGLARGEDGLIDDALAQFASALAVTRRPDGLYAHGYDESRAQDWADLETGQNPALWSRSLGWLAMALADAADLLGPRAADLHAPLADLIERMSALRTLCGLWLQVPDQPDLTGNYEESSASVMIAYAALSAARQGIAPGARPLGLAALKALTRRLVPDPETGALRFEGICHVAGLGGRYPGRDGTAAYYLSEPVIADDAKGAGPLMMAEAERIHSSFAIGLPAARGRDVSRP